MWKKIIPSTQWLRDYSFFLFGADALAGIMLACYAIPVSLAYATLAGLPPQFGIYGYLLGGLCYAILGTSRHLAIGPTSAISLLVGLTLSTMSNGDPQRWIDLASMTAVVFSIISVTAYLLRLSSIINFISETVLLGFKAGAAITIGLTQLPKLFGVPGGGSNTIERVKELTMQIPDTKLSVLIFGICVIILILLGQRLLPGKPVTLTIVIISIILMTFTPMGGLGFKIVGDIPAGLPKLHLPKMHLQDMIDLMPLAFASFLLAYIESVSAAKAMSQKYGYEIDAHQELLALGVTNFVVAVGGGYPVSGGLSQSAVNEKAGAKTPMSLIIASFFIAIVLYLTFLLKNLPTVILASLVLVAIKGLVDIKEFRRLWKGNRFDFAIAIIALISVISFGILQGVIIGAVASLLLIIRIVSSPHIAFLGKIPGTERYTDLRRHPDNEQIPGVLIIRVEAPLLYFNVSNVHHAIWSRIKLIDEPLKIVIMDLSSSAYMDSSGARFVKKFYNDLHDRGVTLKLAEAHSEVRDILRFEDVEHLLGHVSRRDSLHEIIIHSVGDDIVGK